MSPLARMEMRTEGGAIVATVVGEVDISNAADLGSALEGAVPQRALGLVLDLSDATYIDSAGIGLFARFRFRCAASGLHLQAILPGGMTGHALRIVRIFEGFEVHVEHAVA